MALLTKEGVSDSIKAVPGVIYDLIVYYASSAVFFLAVTLLFAKPSDLHQVINKMSPVETIILTIVGLALCYIWGQLSSALSYFMIKKPVSRLARRRTGSKYDDYFFNRPGLLDKFEILETTDRKMGNYWTILYYIRVVNPEIADDLLRRYARCKLARVNALHFLILSTLYLIVYCVDIKSRYTQVSDAPFGFPHPFWIGPSLFAISLVFVYEFYQRQCWFGDIIYKIYAAIERTQSGVKAKGLEIS